MQLFTTKAFAASTYGCGAYGASTYSNATCGVSSDTGTPNTGFQALYANPLFLTAAALALAVIFAGLILIIKRLHRRAKQPS